MSDLHMRVSDEDRERTAGRLQHAFVEGRLTRSELEDRLGLALTARTYRDLLGLITDLPEQRQPPQDDVVEPPCRRAARRTWTASAATGATSRPPTSRAARGPAARTWWSPASPSTAG
ncbi:DUF1707 domain-containing protein [Nonomuraea bangladeshensis]|uniref:DUF1707 SHOCT-like domain-containing protein n=1 Tax=Nonomuraea bangladeshensis TaxID=404385 RepID=UPI0031E19242